MELNTTPVHNAARNRTDRWVQKVHGCWVRFWFLSMGDERRRLRWKSPSTLKQLQTIDHKIGKEARCGSSGCYSVAFASRIFFLHLLRWQLINSLPGLGGLPATEIQLLARTAKQIPPCSRRPICFSFRPEGGNPYQFTPRQACLTIFVKV